MCVLFTKFMWQLMAEHSHRCGQAGPPRQGESSSHGQTVCKVVDAITDGYHVRQQPLFCGGRRSELEVEEVPQRTVQRDAWFGGITSGTLFGL